MHRRTRFTLVTMLAMLGIFELAPTRAWAAGVGGQSAQKHATYAINSARTLYKVTVSYSPSPGQITRIPYTPAQFQAQTPGYTWTTGTCRHQPSSCVSEDVVDVSTIGDYQGVVLAVWAGREKTCWYVVDLEATPVVVQSDPYAFDTGSNKNGSVLNAGVYYGRSPTNPAACAASTAAGAAHKAHWGSTWASAGIVS